MQQAPHMYPAQHPPFNPQAGYPGNQLTNGHQAPAVNGSYGAANGPQNQYSGSYQPPPPLGLGYQPPLNQHASLNNHQSQPAPYESSYGQQAVQSAPVHSTGPLGQPAAYQNVPPQQPPMKMTGYAPQYEPAPVPQHQADNSHQLHDNRYMDNGMANVQNDNRMHQMPAGPMSRYAAAPPHVLQPHQTASPVMHGQANQQGYYGGGQQMQQQPQRLDPDAMPSVVQVIQDDMEKHSRPDNVIFATTIPANVPPLVTTIKPESVVHDGGSARPQHVTCTMYQVPVTEDLLKASSIPLGIVVKPFDESEVDGNMTVPITESEIIRCNRCRAYMSPYMRFTDGGRRFQCALCHHVSEVPQTYYAHLDHMGHRLDRYERPELYLGSYEFKATAEFCRHQILNCRRPHIVFAFELTANSMPVIRRIVTELPAIIREHLPVDALRRGSPPPLVGFMTYNSKIQFYDVRSDGRANVVCDVTQTFPPITSFLVDPIEHADKIDSFLENLLNMYNEDEMETESILGPVIEAALQTCQVDDSNWFVNEDSENPATAHPTRDYEKSVPAGKVYLFHCTLPTYGQDGVTPGRLRPRWTTSQDEVKKLLGTDKEKQILSPEQSKYYTTLAQKCVSDYGSAVELFLFPPIQGSYLDIATLSELTRLTGSGGIYKYYNEVGDRFLLDLKYSLRSTFAFEAIMKVRTSAGIRPFEYYGHYYSRVPADVELGAINAGNSIAVDFRYDDKLSEDEFAVIQVAVLYTAVSGERRVRCHNIGLPVCNQIADVFRSACCDSLMNILVRQAVSSLRLGEQTVQQVKEALISRSVSILTAYRRHCAQPNSSLGQLILPEALKLLPMYVTGALKCDAIDGGPEMTPDDKAFAQIRTLGASPRNTQVILYPRLLRIEYENDTLETLRTVHVRCSEVRLADPNAVAYILENSFYLFFYVVSNPSPSQGHFIKNVFGVDSAHAIVPETGLPQLLTSESQFINQKIKEIWQERRKAMRTYVIRQGMDNLELVFKSFLYEDKKLHAAVAGETGRHEAPSYVDLLCHLHKEIRQNLH